MEKAIFIIIVIFGIMFLTGIIMSIFAFYFNKHKSHTILTILFSILLLPLIYLPMIYTIGFISQFVLILLIPYSIWMVVWGIRNKIIKKQITSSLQG